MLTYVVDGSRGSFVLARGHVAKSKHATGNLVYEMSGVWNGVGSLLLNDSWKRIPRGNWQ